MATQIEQSVAVSSGRSAVRDRGGGRLERRARVAQVLVVAPGARLAGLADDARMRAQRAGERRGAGGAPRRAVRRTAHERDDVGHGSSGSTIVATRRASAGAGRSVTSTPDDLRRLGDLGQQRAQAAVAEAAIDRPVQPRHDPRVEHVEVEVHEDLALGQQLGQPRRALDEPDAVGLDQDALAGVDVADAAHDHARRVHVAVLEAGVPRPARR